MTHPAHRHLVGGECSCLVGADDRRAAKSLDRGQTAHNGVLLGHAACAEGEAGCDDGRQAFWDSSHGQRNSDLEVVDRPLVCDMAKQGYAMQTVVLLLQ